MKIIWLGHSGFRIEIEDQVLLIDPWLSNNPSFPDEERERAIQGTTAILMTHGHSDHIEDIPAIASATGAPVAGVYELAEWMEKSHGLTGIGFGKGGTIRLGRVEVTLVNAVHSSSTHKDGQRHYVGVEAGFMISGEGKTIYVSGDTDVMADMEIFNDLHSPDIGLLSCGGYFTMDMRRAAYAANKFFNFKTVIPCHYKTFPMLEQSADVLIQALPNVDVVEPEVMHSIDL
ncbi:metal-dependent hydrolase [Shimia sagamensis]|uniref:UPF0173 metal-dependent hydrolase SAMN06265373_103422 n=1 Tax=Shimia sagamensis TaxID=1566352 RepID=A0ABY1NVJ8_9RHOB|nr:metal-dependent hydrolase [Shimia sagamensis]SMP19469.1 L-ascorbate metabolism protein UlaG, beta-lactamase superfamily [Shimia sagamensis]